MSYRIEPGSLYRHFKGNYYIVEDFAYSANNNDPRHTKVVVYRSLSDNKLYVRDFEEFSSIVDHIKYPDVSQIYRFEKVNVNKMLKKLLDNKGE